MINKIINTFYNLAKEHVLIRSFKYDRVSKAMGIGNELHPMLFLEDPIYLQSSKPQNGIVKATTNFSILLTPQSLENLNIEQPTIQTCQALAHSIALNMVAKIRDDAYNIEIEPTNIDVEDYNFTTLRNYYDNAACGVRCTINLLIKNAINFCDEDMHFDPNKEFEIDNFLPDFNTDDATGCSGDFSYKLPKFNIN